MIKELNQKILSNFTEECWIPRSVWLTIGGIQRLRYFAGLAARGILAGHAA